MIIAIIYLVVSFIAAGLVISACMLSSRISVSENHIPVESYQHIETASEVMAQTSA